MAAHQYDALTSRLVWTTLVEDIPVLRDDVAEGMIPALRWWVDGRRGESPVPRIRG